MINKCDKIEDTYRKASLDWNTDKECFSVSFRLFYRCSLKSIEPMRNFLLIMFVYIFLLSTRSLDIVTSYIYIYIYRKSLKLCCYFSFCDKAGTLLGQYIGSLFLIINRIVEWLSAHSVGNIFPQVLLDFKCVRMSVLPNRCPALLMPLYANTYRVCVSCKNSPLSITPYIFKAMNSS